MIKVISITLLLGVSIYFLYNKYDKEKAERIYKSEMLDSLVLVLSDKEAKIDLLEKLNYADSLFFAGQYDTAFNVYGELELTNPEIKNFENIKNERINLINKNNQLKNQHELSLAVLKAEKEQYLGIIEDRTKRINSMMEEKVKLNLAFASDRDSFTILTQNLLDSVNNLQILLDEQREPKRELLVFMNNKGSEIHYLGEIKNNMANGNGIGIWKNGGMYKGEWKDNMRHGNGQYQWQDGETYDGDFFMDMRHGKGKYIWTTGLYYIGEWKGDKRHGTGVLYEKNGETRLSGFWEGDEFKKSDS